MVFFSFTKNDIFIQNFQRVLFIVGGMIHQENFAKISSADEFYKIEIFTFSSAIIFYLCRIMNQMKLQAIKYLQKCCWNVILRLLVLTSIIV